MSFHFQDIREVQSSEACYLIRADVPVGDGVARRGLPL